LELSVLADVSAARLATFGKTARVITRASNGKRPGHPVIVPKSLFSNMKDLDGDVGAQDILRQSSVAQQLCDIASAATFDIDTIEDANRAAAERPLIDLRRLTH
jgi:molybdenum cofactor cytidylyltransferase